MIVKFELTASKLETTLESFMSMFDTTLGKMKEVISDIDRYHIQLQFECIHAKLNYMSINPNKAVETNMHVELDKVSLVIVISTGNQTLHFNLILLPIYE